MWAKALKQYGINTGKFNIPRKGTPEHAAVMVILNDMKNNKPSLDSVPIEADKPVKNVSKKLKKNVSIEMAPINTDTISILDAVPTEAVTIKNESKPRGRTKKRAILDDVQ